MSKQKKKRTAREDKKKAEKIRTDQLPTITTMDEFRKLYFPKPSASRTPDDLTPQQVGEKFAEQSLAKMKTLLEA